MFGLLTMHLAAVAGAAAAVQVTRGVVRGAGRLARGEPRGALAEVGGGLAAPAVAWSARPHNGAARSA